MSELIQIIFYGGAFQGFLLSVFLFSVRTNKISNRLLALLTLSWGIVLLVFALQEKGLYQKYPHFGFAFDQLIFLFFPLLYLHVKYLLTSHIKFNLRDLLHFLPFVISIILHMDFFIQSGQEKADLMFNRTQYYIVLEIVLNEVISLQGILYSVFAIMLIKKYEASIMDYVSSVHKNIITVLYIGITLNLLSWIMGIIDVHLRYFNIELGIDLFAITYMILVLVIYAISYAALKSPEIFKLEISPDTKGKFVIRNLVKGSKAYIPKQTLQNDSGNTADLTATDSLIYNDLNIQLVNYIENKKPFLNPELSLPILAESLNVSRNQLSIVINQVHKKNFYEFINNYRIIEVKRLMTAPANKHLKLISLAYDAGFNSKATFNRIFKQMTGMTPSQFFSEQKVV